MYCLNKLDNLVTKDPGIVVYLSSKYGIDNIPHINPAISEIELLCYHKNGVYLFNLNINFKKEYIDNSASLLDIKEFRYPYAKVKRIYTAETIELNNMTILDKNLNGYFNENHGGVFLRSDVHHIVFHRNPDLGIVNTLHCYIIDGCFCFDGTTVGEGLKTFTGCNLFAISELCVKV